MKNAIKNEIPVEITISDGERVYVGICLKETPELLVLVNLDVDMKGYTGVSIILSEDIESFRYIDDVEEIVSLNLDQVGAYRNRLPLNKIEDMKSAIKNLSDEPLMALYTVDDSDSYFVGKVEKTNKSIFEFKTVDPDGNWSEVLEIAYDGVTYIGFDTDYERGLLKKVKE